jgi:hypothetical protein
VAFNLVVDEDSSPTWYDEFSKVVHAPALSLVTLRVDDTASGNGDGVVDADEEFTLYYGVKNFGTGAAYGLVADLVDVGGGFVFTDSTDGYVDLGAMDEAENTGGFVLREPDVLVEHDLEITITDAWGRAYVDTFELRPPDPPLFLLFDPSLGADRLHIDWQASSSADATHYNIYRSDTPGGPYTIDNVDPVDHTVYMSINLAPSMRYYYVATTVDASGNESAQSMEFSGTTNPALLDGWPIQMEVGTTGSPAIGDIDGDGDLEIVQGCDKVYAWHHDGVELFDGDGNAQSWGILTTAGQDYVGPVALARIDGKAGLDIIAASRTTQEVYVFDYQGNTLPGWPRPVENTIRAGTVAGDINNDGILEVLAADEKGVVYVWNPDGSEYIDGDANPSTQGVFYRLPGCTLLFSAPTVADIDSDGLNEIIMGTQSNELYVFNEDGSFLSPWPITMASYVSSNPAVGDIDADGDLEIVVILYDGRVYAFHHDGTQLWYKKYNNGIFFGPSPALGDLNGNGKLETVFPSANGNLYAITWNGGWLGGWPVQYSDHTYTESTPIIADIDGDGLSDVILGDETKVIKAWGRYGNLKDGFPIPVADATRGVPALADIDDDGDIDLISAGWDSYVYVWDLLGAYDPDEVHWPGFHGNRHNDGLYGSVIPTGIGGVAFSFEAGERGVSLSWALPASAGYLFDVRRAQAGEDGEAAGAFGLVASGLTVGPDGTLGFVDAGAGAGGRYIYELTGGGWCTCR